MRNQILSTETGRYHNRNQTLLVGGIKRTKPHRSTSRKGSPGKENCKLYETPIYQKPYRKSSKQREEICLLIYLSKLKKW